MMEHQALCRQKFDKPQRDELEAVFKKLSTPLTEYAPGCTFGALMMEYTDFIDQVTLGVGLLSGVSPRGQKAGHAAAEVVAAPTLPVLNLQRVAKRVGSVKIGSMPAKRIARREVFR